VRLRAAADGKATVAALAAAEPLRPAPPVPFPATVSVTHTVTDPERGKVALADYAATWISQRPKLRRRTVDHYRWLPKKHIAPHLAGSRWASCPRR